MRVRRAHLLAATVLSLAISLAVAPLASAPLHAQSARGIWQGTAYTGDSSQPVTIVLDSSATGWTGAAVAPDTQADSLRLSSVTLRGDTLSFNVSVNGSAVHISGVITAGKFNGRIWIDDSEAGTMELTHKPRE